MLCETVFYGAFMQAGSPRDHLYGEDSASYYYICHVESAGQTLCSD